MRSRVVWFTNRTFSVAVMLCFWMLCFWMLAGPFVLADTGKSKSKAQRTKQAAQLVMEALEAESSGEMEIRNRLLVEAESLTGDFPLVQWHLGKVFDSDQKWRSIEDSCDRIAGSKLLDQYERMRSPMPDAVESHWQLAEWCAKNKLAQQCLAHLERVIQIDSNHIGARSALGHQFMAGQWITSEELLEMEAKALLAQRSYERYGAQVQEVLMSMQSGSAVLEQKGRSSLMAVRDPLAVSTVESLVNGYPDQVTLPVVNWIASLDDASASQSLVRFALLHPSESTRRLASQHLKSKPLYDFVPELLTMLSGPVEFMAVPVLDRSGRFLGYRQAFAREGMNEVRLSINDRGFQRERVELRDPPMIAVTDSSRLLASPTRSGFRPNQSRVDIRRAAAQLNQMVNQMCAATATNEIMASQISATRENQIIEERNQRIGHLITQVASLPPEVSAKEIWEWWDEYNETNYQSYKPQRYDYNSISERVPQYAPTCECFVAGTLVMTSRGLRPIERMVVGDLALSRNISSGKLSWQPVIAVTTQPPNKTVTIEVGETQFSCTSGHLFWVSGSGWMRASQITVGDWIHGAAQPAKVKSVRDSNTLPTFNLEIEQDHTYFVGKELVLSHDVTPRRTSRQLVPGYRRSQQNVDVARVGNADQNSLLVKAAR